MHFIASFAALFSLALTQIQAADQSLCDKYVTALLKVNSVQNQRSFLTAIVDTAFIGNFSAYSIKKVPNFKPIWASDSPILKYFDGSLEVINLDGLPTKVNFLDGGGAQSLMIYSADTSDHSNQYQMMFHLYQYFSDLLGCSTGGNHSDPNDRSFPGVGPYQGVGSMSRVHRFMNLTQGEVDYFISAFAASAESFGFSSEDATTFADTLNTTFNYACLPPTSIAGSAKVSQSICLNDSCPKANPANCTAGHNSYPDAEAAAVTYFADNETNNGFGASSGSSGSSTHDDAASTDMASIALASALGLGALVVATLF